MKTSFFDKLIFGIILVTVFFLPLFFLPVTVDFYLFNKKFFLIFATGLLYLLWALKSVLEKRLVVKKDFSLLPALGLTAAFWLASFVSDPNRAFSLMGATSTITALFFFYIVVVNFVTNKKQVKWVLAAAFISLSILAWLTVFSYLELPKQFNLGPTWLRDKFWTPTGAPLITAALMLSFLPLTLFWAFKSSDNTEKVLLFLAGSLQVLGLVLTISLFLSKAVPWLYLPPQYGWQIVAEGFKNIKTAFIGTGPENFSATFSRFRPVALNTTPLWNIRFLSNSNYYFQLLSTVGLLGLLTYLWFTLGMVRKAKASGFLMKALKLGLVTSLIIQLIISVDLLLLFVTFLLAALISVLKQPETVEVKQKVASYIAGGLTAALIILCLNWHFNAWQADRIFRQSLVAAQQNKGIETYNLQVQAIKLNPFVENYRIAYSQTNFALASSIAQKKDLTDQDRNNANQLISQAINEAKAAVTLNPQQGDYWANLASIYRNIIAVADGAKDWAVTAYNQAVANDPTNVLLRVDFGGLFYVLEDYERAIEQFKVAINLKPDFANAYYNLSAVYQQTKDWTKAYENLQLAINLIDTNSEDRQKAMKELEDLKTKLPVPPPQASQSAKTQGTQQLQQPSPLASPKPGFNRVSLPETAAPPEASPVPTESPIPSPTAKP
jgi:tetratricopeptide (TPR) repeat protein